ncbi:hypothetical protein AMTR_s00005p00061430 [Amborella trichopoda]|uniref:Uncharacterized protein n=1 Tax=Amborella trichopoda TaxID=13333 RepID=W1PA21_AMBTC|nr:hypothetical protein AMTR_s00005p00061430 [Amborella trichopoda]
MVKECPLSDLAAKVATVRDCTLKVVGYDKGVFDQFEDLLMKLDHWGTEALQQELEVHTLCGPQLATQHQGVLKGYEEEKRALLSN